ncbi:penicillin-binding protein activator [Patescibacteria group bacterium AH-259-L07]|nr:penicillin-binding protein activator [Patescibacteria group bacterium AH-259-L07]
MSKTLKYIIGIIIAIIIIFALYRGQTPSEQGVITIGFMGPLTGDAASYGESIKRGLDLSVQDMNLAKVEVMYEDSKCEGKDAVNAINKLISINKVVAIVGEVCSGATLAAAPVANDNAVVLISSASTSPKLSEAGAYIFRTVPSDALQGNFGAQLVYDKGYRNLAILYSNEEYGIGFTTVLTQSFEGLGGEVVASESFERNATDIRTQLTKIKAEAPDALYIVSNSPASAVASLRQVKELGIKLALFGSEGLKSPDIVESAQEAAEGLVLTSVSSGTSGFIEKHRVAYETDPGPFAAQAYDAFFALGRAIEGGATTGEQIKDALFGIEFEGASGYIKFDQNGDVLGNYDVYTVQDGAFVLMSE